MENTRDGKIGGVYLPRQNRMSFVVKNDFSREGGVLRELWCRAKNRNVIEGINLF